MLSFPPFTPAVSQTLKSRLKSPKEASLDLFNRRIIKMVRPLRIEFEGAVYHITSRGNAKQNIFLNRTDRVAFLNLLKETVERFEWICHAYCLMDNHYHLLIETPRANLSRGMRHLNAVYTQGFNRRHDLVGHVLQGRFKSILVERDRHLLELTRYVVLNPIRAGFVRSPDLWPWSSYKATAGLEAVPEFLEIRWLLSQFADDPKQAVDEYRAFVAAGYEADPWQNLRGPILGSERFVENMEPLLKEKNQSQEYARREKAVTCPTLERLFSADDDKVTRNRKIRDAVRKYEYTLKEVADHLGLHYTTISVIARKVAEEPGKKGAAFSQRSVDGLEERKS
jgi:REP element-mobilizing transposase RayT